MDSYKVYCINITITECIFKKVVKLIYKKLDTNNQVIIYFYSAYWKDIIDEMLNNIKYYSIVIINNSKLYDYTSKTFFTTNTYPTVLIVCANFKTDCKQLADEIKHFLTY
jgi:hypothetical protein